MTHIDTDELPFGDDSTQPVAQTELEISPQRAAIMEAVSTILSNIGEDPQREGLQKTPYRVAKMYDELLDGYHTDLDQLVNNALYTTDYDEMVIVKNIEYFSFCEHHFLPFWGVAHIAYIPNGKVIGLSKIPRIVDMFARRLQIQETLTQQIANTISQLLAPHGVAVMIEGVHMCAMMRGVKKQKSSMVTTALTGKFKEDRPTRQEFFSHLGNRMREFS